MATTMSIETVITFNSKIATFPKLASICDQYLAALQGGYEPDPALLTEMFAVLVEISATTGALDTALTNLLTEIVEQVLVRDTALGANTELGRMLSYYSERLSDGYPVDEQTAAAIVNALEAVTTGEAPLQVLLDELTQALSPLPPTFGFTLTGIDANDSSGSWISSAGDVNGDGVGDILIGAPFANGTAGETYVVFGREGAGAFGATLDLADLDGTNGFTLMGIDANDYSGYSVSSAGDVNGDSIDDILIGAYRANGDEGDEGETYVVFGREGAGAFGATLGSGPANPLAEQRLS